MKSFICLFSILLSLSLFSEDITGKVIGVYDGDTVTVLDNAKKQYKIRLVGIDAPESKQDFGSKSKQFLSSMIFSKKVIVKSSGKDRYGRYLGTIYLGDINVNLEMVKQGFAWHYKQYSKDKALAEAEEEARSAGRAIWSHKQAQAPWEYRKSKRSKQSTPEPKTDPNGKYWISRSSQKRHNSNCKVFKNSNGYQTNKKVGTACKLCGG